MSGSDNLNAEAAGAYSYTAFNGQGELVEQRFATNTDPVAFTAAPDQIRYVLLEADGQLSIVASQTGWHRAGSVSHNQEKLVHVSTDRPIYQPGQTVFFKGIIRQDDDGQAENVNNGFRVVTNVYDSRNNQLWQFELETNDFGTVNGSFQIAEGASLGTYQIRMVAGDYQETISFKVEEYRKPEYEVTTFLSDTRVSRSQAVDVTVASSYFFGSPVANADVVVNAWSVSSDGYFYNKRQIASGRTDDLGNYEAIWKPTDSGRYVIEAVVRDSSNFSIAGVVPAQVFETAELLGVERGQYVYQPGDLVRMRTSVTDLYGKPVVGRAVTAAVARYARGGGYSAIPGAFSAISDNAGNAVIDLNLAEPGWYRATTFIVDDNGHRMERVRYFLVWNSSWQGYLRQDDSLHITADKEHYRPGDVATFVIESDTSGPARLTFERGRIYEIQDIELTTPITIVEIPVTTTFAPNVFVTVQRWDELDNSLTERTYKSIPDAMLRIATVSIQVTPTDQLLNLEIIPERDQYGPGETAVLTLSVTNAQGIPVSAEIELALVDEAIFSLAKQQCLPTICCLLFGSTSSCGNVR